MEMLIRERNWITWERLLLLTVIFLVVLVSEAQNIDEDAVRKIPLPPRQGKVEVYDDAIVRDSVNAAIQRELGAGLWAKDIASGSLIGDIGLRFTIDHKGHANSVFVPNSTLPVKWKNLLTDHWYDHRFDIRLPKGHVEKVDIQLHFP